MHSLSRKRRGFTLVELLVVIAIIGVLVGLLLPAVQAAREAARRMSCSNNFRQIGLAIHNYHAAYKQLPRQYGGTWVDGNTPTNYNNRYLLGFLVGLTPFMEQQGVWEQIVNANQQRVDGGIQNPPYPPMGPAPWTGQYIPWRTEIPTLRCPSDPGVGAPAFGRTNYAACLGDSIDFMHNGPVQIQQGRERKPPANWVAVRARSACRGFFVARQDAKFRDILDGLANTIAAGEIATDLGDRDKRTIPSRGNGVQAVLGRTGTSAAKTCEDAGQISPERPQFWSTGADGGTAPTLGGTSQGRGYRWAYAGTIWSSMNTILPPNAELCLGSNGVNGPGIVPPSSRHQGGCHILMGDGAVIFMSDSVDAGDPRAPQVWGGTGARGTGGAAPGSMSPFGLWGALGTRAVKEVIEEQLNQ